jgi:hypothetical protein
MSAGGNILPLAGRFDERTERVASGPVLNRLAAIFLNSKPAGRKQKLHLPAEARSACGRVEVADFRSDACESRSRRCESPLKRCFFHWDTLCNAVSEWSYTIAGVFPLVAAFFFGGGVHE